MKVLMLLVLLLSACDEIDGALEVFSRFTLVDEDGNRRQIEAGNYSADFSYSRKKKEVELEIDDFVGSKDIDFEFRVPQMHEIDFRSPEIEIEVLAENNGQGVDLRAIIEREREEFGPYRKRFGERCHDPYARFTHPQVIYDVTEVRVYVEIEIGASSEGEGNNRLASFQGEDCSRYIEQRYCIDCYGRIDRQCVHHRSTWCN